MTRYRLLELTNVTKIHVKPRFGNPMFGKGFMSRCPASWLRQVEAYLRDTGMAGLASGRIWRLKNGTREPVYGSVSDG